MWRMIDLLMDENRKEGKINVTQFGFDITNKQKLEI